MPVSGTLSRAAAWPAVTVALGLPGTAAALKISGPLAGSLAVTLLAVAPGPIGAAIAAKAVAAAGARPSAAEPAAAKLARPCVLRRPHREFGLTPLRRFVGEPGQRCPDQRPMYRLVRNSLAGLDDLYRVGIGSSWSSGLTARVGREV